MKREKKERNIMELSRIMKTVYIFWVVVTEIHSNIKNPLVSGCLTWSLRHSCSTLEPGFDTLLCLLTPASCYCRSWEAVGMAQLTGFLPSTWDIWVSLWLLAWALAGTITGIWRATQLMGIFCLSNK